MKKYACGISDLKEALKDLNQAIYYDSKNPDALFKRRCLKRKFEIYEEALEDLDKAI